MAPPLRHTASVGARLMTVHRGGTYLALRYLGLARFRRRMPTLTTIPPTPPTPPTLTTPLFCPQSPRPAHHHLNSCRPTHHHPDSRATTLTGSHRRTRRLPQRWPHLSVWSCDELALRSSRTRRTDTMRTGLLYSTARDTISRRLLNHTGRASRGQLLQNVHRITGRPSHPRVPRPPGDPGLACRPAAQP